MLQEMPIIMAREESKDGDQGQSSPESELLRRVEQMKDFLEADDHKDPLERFSSEAELLQFRLDRAETLIADITTAVRDPFGDHTEITREEISERKRGLEAAECLIEKRYELRRQLARLTMDTTPSSRRSPQRFDKKEVKRRSAKRAVAA